MRISMPSPHDTRRSSENVQYSSSTIREQVFVERVFSPSDNWLSLLSPEQKDALHEFDEIDRNYNRSHQKAAHPSI